MAGVGERLEVVGGSGPRVVFVHANGWPLGSYRAFLSQLTAHCHITGYHQRPMWSIEAPPRTLNWHTLATDLLETLHATVRATTHDTVHTSEQDAVRATTQDAVHATAQDAVRASEQDAVHATAHTTMHDSLHNTPHNNQGDGPVWLMGHSMGAVVSVFAAVRAPQLVRGLLLIDPVMISRWRAIGRDLMPPPLHDRMPMIAKAMARPNRFASRQDAFDFYRTRRVFAQVSDAVLWDYVNASTKPATDHNRGAHDSNNGSNNSSNDSHDNRNGNDNGGGGHSNVDNNTHNDRGGYVLSYAREWEAAAYRGAPCLWPALRKLRVPMLGLRGELSEVASHRDFQRWARVHPRAVLRNCPGGHLLPLEFPTETAAAVIDFLGNS